MKIGAYDIIRPIGSGGMSDALLARSPTGRVVVLKKPKSRDPEIVARMRDEGRLGAKLYHESLVETLDMFEFEGYPVLALGFVEGVTVDELRKKAPLAPAGAARIGCQIAEALGAIHGALGDDGGPLGAVHRDVSARNILVTPAGNAVLIDLGIARTDEARVAHTETGMVLGTLRYMAPELIDGHNATPASDFYSLGCVLIEAVSGRSVFEGPPSEVAAQIVAKGAMAGAAAAALASPLRDVVARMVAMKPDDRFKESHDLSAALRSVEVQLGGGSSSLGDRAKHELLGTPPPAAPAPVTGIGSPSFGTSAFESANTFAEPSSASFSAMSSVSGSNVFTSTPSLSPRAPTESAMHAFTAPLPQPSASLPSSPQRASPSSNAPSTSNAPLPSLAARAQASAPLELAVEPRRKVTRVETPADARDWYPQRKRDYSAITSAAKAVVGIVVVGAALFFGWRWYTQQSDDDSMRAANKAADEARLLRQAMGDTAASPGCDQPGAVWVYTDKHGADVIVDSISKIPAADRSKARCAIPSR